VTTRLIFDLETDGLIGQLTRIHCLGIRDADTGEEWCFRQNAFEDTIEDGLDMLAEADMLIGHNILPFDLRVIEMLYPWWEGKEGQRIRDTLVMCQMIFANQKEKDFKAWKKNKLPGNQIGKHGLEAWGHRTGNYKGDYQKDMKAKGLDPWAEWNQAMEDYMMQDLSTNQSLWDLLEAEDYPEEPIVLEHQVQELLTEQQMNGVYFDVARAKALADELDAEITALAETARQHYGSWWAPAKKHQIAPLWKDPAGKWKEKAKKCGKPRPEYGEDDSRKVWAEVAVPKVTYKWNPQKPNKPPMDQGVPYCKVVLKEFNPTSRQMIIDRFTTIYGWEPNPDEESEWTDGGAPAVGDKILRALEHIPMAAELAELFYHNKRLGQLRDGKQALLNKVTPEGKIHHRCNSGGTVSGRGAHSDPNLGQVPKVKSGTLAAEEFQEAVRALTKPRADYLYKQLDDQKWSGPLRGRKGKHGFEFRDLLYVPDGWDMVGCDLSGIEFRCLANLTAPYDGGSLIHEVLEGDIHTTNQEAAELDTRDQAKTFIYACVTENTQALTVNGWKYYHELSVGELVLTYNAERDVPEWQPIKDLVYYEDAEVIEMSNGEFCVTTTPNHRWFCRRRVEKNGQRTEITDVRTTAEIDSEDKIITNVPHVNNYVSGARLKKRYLPNQPVWCLKTENNSFVMRQGSTITITGNTMYGGGDAKLGSIKNPAATIDEQRNIGSRLRAKFMSKMPALAKAIKQIQKQVRRFGYIEGLDGRRLLPRSPHSALNLKLQSDAALIAKKWMILAIQRLEEEHGLIMGWDELQFAARHRQIEVDGRRVWLKDLVAEEMIACAAAAGEYFGFQCPVDAEAKIGRTWAETH
jgi:DNA polymerase I-like protein with 3'-5' exonuclease and polymerase domains